MNRTERKEYREEKRKLRRERKRYFQEDKESAKRQKRELKEQRKEWRRKHGRKSYWRFLSIFFISSEKLSGKERLEMLKDKHFAKRQRKKHIREEKRSTRRQGKELRRSIRLAQINNLKGKILFLKNALLKIFIKKETPSQPLEKPVDEKHLLKQEMSEMRARIKKRRIQIRKVKRQQFWSGIIRWLKNPFLYKRLGRREKLMREQAKQNLRNDRKHNKKEIRQKRRLAYENFLFQRKERYKGFIRSLSDFISTLISIIKLKPLQRDYLKTLINSTFLFVLSFFIIQYLSQLITIYMAKVFDIPAVLHSYRIFWPLYTYSSLYTRPALIIIFGMGPLVCLALGFGLYKIYLWIRKYNLVAKTLILWLIFHAFNWFFGAYIVGVITRTGFIYSSEWIFLSNVFDVEEIIFMIVCLFILVYFGYLSTRQFMFAANSEIIIEKRLRLYYLISMVLLPWIFGNLILFFINYPRNPLELKLLYLVSVLMIIPIFTNFNTLSIQMIKVQNLSGKVKLGWIYIILTIVAVILIRIFIFHGVRFS